MSEGTKSLEELKKEAVAKAKEEARRKLEERKKAAESEKTVEKQKALSEEPEASNEDEKAKAIAIAKAKAAAAAKAKAAALAKQKGEEPETSNEDEKAKAIAIAKVKAAAAAKVKAKATETVEETPQTPSVNQPYVDKYVRILKEHVGEDCLEDAYINRLSKEVPTLVVAIKDYYKVCAFLKHNEQLAFNYVSSLHGTDFVTHFEVYTHLYSYVNKQSVAVKVKIDRQEATIDSITPLWAGADWPEREVYDLLGITFTNHPNLKRILLSDDWIGYPLRKDYEPFDVEV